MPKEILEQADREVSRIFFLFNDYLVRASSKEIKSPQSSVIL